MNCPLYQYVTDKFIRDLEELTADEFVEAYGTHVLTDITLGGVLRVLYRASIIDETNSLTKTNTLKAGFNVTLNKIGLGMTIDETATITESQVKKNLEKTLFILYKSGEGVDIKFDESIDKSYPSINKVSWEQSVNKENAGLVDINWAKTFPIYDFIPQSHSYKKQVIKDAVKKYIEKAQINSLELIPVYQWYNPNGGQYAYGTNTTQVHGPEYICHGVSFWIPKNSNNETIPVYQWYLPSRGIYAYGTNTVEVHGPGYICHGFAFNTPKPKSSDPNLAPVYQWFRANGGLYAYGTNTAEVHGPGYICHGLAFWCYK